MGGWWSTSIRLATQGAVDQAATTYGGCVPRPSPDDHPPVHPPTPEQFFAALDVGSAPRDLVALGGRLDVATLTAAYRHGCFPWPASEQDERAQDRAFRRLARRGQVPLLPGAATGVLVPWCSTEPRAVLVAEQVTPSRTLRQVLRRSGWTTTMDTAFPQVLVGCAAREETWITGAMRAAYVDLFAAGIAHSVEVWDGADLVGGLYGVLTGRIFSGESMFHRVSGAAKVAVIDLCDRLLEVGAPLVDVQQETELLTSLGAVLIARAEYVQLAGALRDSPVQLPTDRRPVDRLASRFGQPV